MKSRRYYLRRELMAAAARTAPDLLYKQAAAAVGGVSVPKEPLRATKLFDGVIWDGKDPKKYAESFKLKAVQS